MIKKNARYGLLLLVLSGWILNGKYYFSRYMSEGFDLWVALIVSAGLVVLSSILFSMSKKYREQKQNKSKLIIAIWGFLAIYSINCTIAGQYWDQQVKDSQTENVITDKENTAYLTEQYQENIKELKKEYADLESQKKESIKNLEDRYDFKNTLAATEKRQKEIKAEIQVYEQKIEDIIKNNKISVKRTEDIKILKNIYSFYSPDNPQAIQFIFQAILSIFVELMAPLSLMFFMDLKPTKIDDSKKPVNNNKILSYDIIRNFAILAFMNIENKVSEHLLPKPEIVILSRRRGMYIPDQDIQTILDTAEQLELIKIDDDMYKPASEYIDVDYFTEKIFEYCNATESTK